MNIREVDQDDVDEVRTFRQAPLLAERLNYSHDIRQLIKHAVRHTDPSGLSVFVRYVTEHLSLNQRHILLRGFIDMGHPLLVKILLTHGVVLGGGARAVWKLIDVAVMNEKGFLVKFLFDFYKDDILYEYVVHRRRLFSIILYAFGRQPFDESTRTVLAKQLITLHEDIGGDFPLYRDGFLSVVRERSPEGYQRLLHTFERLKIRLTTVVQRKYREKHQRKIHAVKVIQRKAKNVLYRPGQRATVHGTVQAHGYRIPARQPFVPRGIVLNRFVRNFNTLKILPRNVDTNRVRQLNRTIRNTVREMRPRLRNTLQERRNTLSRERTVRKLTQNIFKSVVRDVERESAAYSRRVRTPAGNRVRSLVGRFNR